MLMDSTSLIAEIRVLKFLYLIRKAEAAFPGFGVGENDENGSIFDQILSRGRVRSLI